MLSVGPWVPCSHGNDLQRHMGPGLCSQHPCTQVQWPQLAPTQPALPQGSNPHLPTHHIFWGESSSSLLPHTCLGLSHLPLMSGTQKPGKALQHESPWRVVLSCLTACLGLRMRLLQAGHLSQHHRQQLPCHGQHLEEPAVSKHRPVSTPPTCHLSCFHQASPSPSLPLLAPSF